MPATTGGAVDRRLTLLDAAVLVAATAVGVALVRAVWGPGVPEPIARLTAPPPAHPGGWSPWLVIQRADLVGRVLAVLLLAWTPALLGLRLRRPRPSAGRLMARPGSAALVLATLAVAWKGAESVAREALFQAAGLRGSLAEAFAQEPAGHMPGVLFREGAVVTAGACCWSAGPPASRSAPTAPRARLARPGRRRRRGVLDRALRPQPPERRDHVYRGVPAVTRDQRSDRRRSPADERPAAPAGAPVTTVPGRVVGRGRP